MIDGAGSGNHHARSGVVRVDVLEEVIARNPTVNGEDNPNFLMLLSGPKIVKPKPQP